MTLQTLKLNQITPVADNPRKTFDEQSIEGLAQSILTDGLLQNLVVAKPKGKKKKHLIICGERRYRALTLLQERGDLDKDYAVAVEIKEDLSTEEILRMATVENVQRENLPPLEEAQALATLIQDGEHLDNITAQTGLSVHTIRRRLMLLDLIEEAREQLQSGDINLAQAEALSIGGADDQMRALKQIESGWCDSPEQIKDTIIQRSPSVDLAIFDRELYKGDYISDLLAEDESTFFADEDQFDQLQREAIETLIEKYEQTHDFVEFVEGYFSSYQYREIEEGETGGVVIVLRTSGEVEIHDGLKKPEIDASNVIALKPKLKATYSNPLLRYMAMHKSVAVQASLLANPRIAKELAVANRLYRFDNHDALSYFQYEESGTILPAIEAINAKTKELLDLFTDVQDDMTWLDLGYLFSCGIERAYQAVKTLSDEQLENVFITLNALEFGQLIAEHLDTNAESIFNSVAHDLNVDMRDFWQPDESFLKRRNKEQLTQIINEAGCSKTFGNGKSYKKGELVTLMAKHFASVKTLDNPNENEQQALNWLPEAMQFPAIDPDKQDMPDASEDEEVFEDYPIAAE
ncbi:MAG: ParB/RepB/Spo0J family partition protein [Alphaproteobacteria bacterium]|nr:ParB/RepB/Spo0J family partition protein [Alphaproteobacteria bacterium]